MPRKKKFLIDDDFIYDLPNSADHSARRIIDNSAIESAPAGLISIASIAALEKRIQELECEHMMHQLQIKASKSMARNNGAMIPSSTNASIQPATPGKNISSLDIKSGYDIKKQAPVLNEVSWPHGFLGQVQNITNIDPDKLSIEAFLYGYFVILLHMSRIMLRSMANDTYQVWCISYQLLIQYMFIHQTKTSTNKSDLGKTRQEFINICQTEEETQIKEDPRKYFNKELMNETESVSIHLCEKSDKVSNYQAK